MKQQKHKLVKRVLSVVLSLSMALCLIPSTVFAAEGDVAQIENTTYATLDEAVAAAADGATIELLADATTNGLNLSKNLTIKAAEGLAEKPTITFTQYGIALWGKALTFENCNVVMNGIGSTPYTAEWGWMTICASTDASLTLNNVNMTMDATGTTNSPHAIYFCNNNVLNIENNSNLTIKNYANDALEWDGGNGGYNVNITNSTFLSDQNRSGFTGTFYATITNSDVDVVNSTGNGSNGSHFIIKNSNVNFSDNGSHGLSAGNLTISDDSVITTNNNGRYGVTYTGTMTMDGSSTMSINGNASISGGGLRAANSTTKSSVASGAKITISNNLHNGLENYGTFTFEDGAILTITGNDERTTNGGGIFNGSAGNMTLPKGAVIMNNHAHLTGGGICNAGTIVVPSDVKLYNNHADTAGDDIFNRETSTITFGKVGNGWILDGGEDCNGEEHFIDGWYDDSDGARWEAHAATEDGNHIDEFTDFSENGLATVTGSKALKAAHGADYTAKISLPGIDKDIVTEDGDVKEDTVAAGDTVNFKLESNVPENLTDYIDYTMSETGTTVGTASGTYNLTFHDQMDEQFINPTNFVVKIGDKTLEANQYTLIQTGLADECDFEITLNLIQLYNDNIITEDDFGTTPITITYQATLAEGTPADDYHNTAWVTYLDDESEKVVVTVNTYGITIFKYDSATNAGLEGAVFELYDSNAEGAKPIRTGITSGADGYVTINGLDEGTYYLKETQAPDGYVCSDTPLEIVIPEDANASNVVTVNFANTQIPHTGGMGTTLYTVGGGLIVAAAAVLFVVSRKKRQSK